MESNDEKESIGLITLADSQSKAYVKELYKSYELYLKPLEEVRKILAKEIPEQEKLSKDVVKLRRKETH